MLDKCWLLTKFTQINRQVRVQVNLLLHELSEGSDLTWTDFNYCFRLLEIQIENDLERLIGCWARDREGYGILSFTVVHNGVREEPVVESIVG